MSGTEQKRGYRHGVPCWVDVEQADLDAGKDFYGALFGWVFILGGSGLFALGSPDLPRPLYAHGVMGLFFGALHLAYGIYLFCTEKRKNET